jgi:hypothetical protein
MEASRACEGIQLWRERMEVEPVEDIKNAPQRILSEIHSLDVTSRFYQIPSSRSIFKTAEKGEVDDFMINQSIK